MFFRNESCFSSHTSTIIKDLWSRPRAAAAAARPWDPFHSVLIYRLPYSRLITDPDSVCQDDRDTTLMHFQPPQCKTDADSGISWRTREQDRLPEPPARPQPPLQLPSHWSALHNLLVSEGTDVKTQGRRVRCARMDLRTGRGGGSGARRSRRSPNCRPPTWQTELLWNRSLSLI